MPLNLLSESDFSPKSFDAAEKHFRKKVPLTAEEYARLTAAQKAHAFTVAEVTNARLIQDLRDRLATMIKNGKTWAQIRPELMELFDTAGIPPPAMYRLRFAVEENARRAYADARTAVLDSPEVKAVFGYRMYLTVGNGRPGYRNVRPEHAVLHRKVFRADDPAWRYFTPPWDFGCRCSTIALTAGQVARRKLQVWTYAGGVLRPVNAKKGVKLGPNKKYHRGGEKLDLSSLDADLRLIVEERVK